LVLPGVLDNEAADVPPQPGQSRIQLLALVPQARDGTREDVHRWFPDQDLAGENRALDRGGRQYGDQVATADDLRHERKMVGGHANTAAQAMAGQGLIGHIVRLARHVRYEQVLGGGELLQGQGPLRKRMAGAHHANIPGHEQMLRADHSAKGRRSADDHIHLGIHQDALDLIEVVREGVDADARGLGFDDASQATLCRVHHRVGHGAETEPALGRCRIEGFRCDGLPQISEMFKEFPMAGYEIEYEPTDAFVSKSEDMAWAHGLYRVKAPDGREDIGSYLSVWIKVDAEWKNVAEMRNSNQ
jgi:hypothetical protein